jgi:hypothetical protein
MASEADTIGLKSLPIKGNNTELQFFLSVNVHELFGSMHSNAQKNYQQNYNRLENQRKFQLISKIS